MKMQVRIESKLKAEYRPTHLDLVNESNRHNVPPGSESHFKLTLASEKFMGVGPLQRHRLVYATLADELKDGVHALTLSLFSPEEWESQGAATVSPPCLGGSSK